MKYFLNVIIAVLITKIKYCVSVASIMAVIEDIEFSIGIQQGNLYNKFIIILY